MMNKEWPLRWDLLLRYRLIEIIVFWEGRLTTNHLIDTFGIGRQQASKDINNYNNKVGVGNLVYDKFLKGYKPTPHFKPALTSGTADEYLHLLNRNNDLSQTFDIERIKKMPTDSRVQTTSMPDTQHTPMMQVCVSADL